MERPLELADEAFAASGRPDGELEQAERSQALTAALQHLTAEQREVFVLKHVEGLPYDDIARLTGATVASLKMRIDRKSTRLNSSHGYISYAVFCLKKKKK